MSYSIKTISKYEAIGNSLSSINNNYENLDMWISQIQLSAINLWSPVRDFYKNKNVEFKANVTNSSANKNKWDDLTNIVQINSAKWIEPLVLFYPNVIETNQITENNTISVDGYNKITNWFNTYFPVISTSPLPLYVQNQKAYVYVLKREYGVKTQRVDTLQAPFNCKTAAVNVCLQCKNTYQGYIHCSNGDFNCDGQSVTCQQCSLHPCWYDQTGYEDYTTYMQAFLNISYQDTREQTNITCINYEVQGCNWVYISQS